MLLILENSFTLNSPVLWQPCLPKGCSHQIICCLCCLKLLSSYISCSELIYSFLYFSLWPLFHSLFCYFVFCVSGWISRILKQTKTTGYVTVFFLLAKSCLLNARKCGLGHLKPSLCLYYYISILALLHSIYLQPSAKSALLSTSFYHVTFCGGSLY